MEWLMMGNHTKCYQSQASYFKLYAQFPEKKKEKRRSCPWSSLDVKT
jgi:hypothetical protein